MQHVFFLCCLDPITIQMEKFFEHNLKFDCSYTSMESMAKVVNSTPNAAIQLPTTKHKIKKFFDPIYINEFHIKCSNCENYTASLKTDTICALCDIPTKCTKSNYFVHIPIIQQLKRSIAENLIEILEYSSQVASTNQVTDIHNAEIFKNVQKMHPMHTILPLIVNTDGIKVFNSNSKSLWLIQIYPAYLPPSKRYVHTNVMIVAAHFAPNKPQMSEFFYPFLIEMRESYDEGGITIEKNGEAHNFLSLILSACCDLPAVADLQGFMSHSGYYGCGYCLHPGIAVKGEKKSVVRFIKGSKDYEIRSHEKTIKIYERLKSTPIEGVKKCRVWLRLTVLI